ncbi:MAG: EF-hand domain-containing protein [Verrucomicrobiales bacterium]|nr:EF-hand domain-containing protein [Verrucomicrobiales bacterium]MCP5559270.1 EF-hand domain-containing protein [Verrucomicrobiaceae bacterium]
MKTKQAIIYGLGLACATVITTQAQEGQRPPGGDGASRIQEFMKKADADGDGKVSKEEFIKSQSSELEERFSRVDGNSDGFVDAAEIEQIREKFGSMAGRRGGEGERGAGRPGQGAPEGGGFRRPPEGGRPEGAPPEGRPEGRPQGGPPGQGGEGGRRGFGGPGGPGGMPNGEEIFKKMDGNADGSVDKEEYAAFARQEIEGRFTRMDQNADGKVTQEEFTKGMMKLRDTLRGGQGGMPGGQGGMPGGQGGPGGMRRPGGQGGPGGGEGGFRRPPGQGGPGTEGGTGRPRPPVEGEGKPEGAPPPPAENK